MADTVLASILKKNPRRLQSWRVWIQVSFDALIWGAMIALAHSYPIFVAPLFAIFSFRAFGLMHDCVHSAGHSNSKTNSALGEIYGVFSFLPYKAWKRLHLDHHYWTGNVEKDPSMKILTRFRDNGLCADSSSRVSWKYWIPYLGFIQHVVFWKGTSATRQYGFLFGLVIYATASGLALGIAPVAAGFLIYLYAVEIINFPHHLGLPQYDKEARYPVQAQHQFTRSCVYPRWFSRLVLLNFNLHTEHHLFPSHPWYQLDAIHDDLIKSGFKINMSSGNRWIRINRARQVDDVFFETFQAAVHETVRKAA